MIALLRLAVLTILLTGCAGPMPSGTTPSSADASVPTGPPGSSHPGPSPNQAPSPSASDVPLAATGLGTRWVHDPPLPQDSFIAHGAGVEDGFVAVGECGGLKCDIRGEARAFYSVHGGTWVRASVEDAENAQMATVSTTGPMLAAGWQPKPGDPLDDRVIVWHSASGRSWHVLGHINLDSCRTAGTCEDLGPIARAGTGAIVLGVVDPEPGQRSAIYRGMAGGDWSPVPASAFGLTNMWVWSVDIVSFGGRLVLVGVPCEGCPTRAWTSDDGATWQGGDELGESSAGHVSLAASSTVVAALQVCSGEGGPCQAEVWSSLDGATWTRGPTQAEGLYDVPRAASVGPEFVVVWKDDDEGTISALRSGDGTSWSRLGTNLSIGDLCYVDWVAGSSGSLLLSDSSCGFWRSSGLP